MVGIQPRKRFVSESTHTSKYHQSLEPSYTAAFDEKVGMSNESNGEQGCRERSESQRWHVVVDADVCLAIWQRSRFRVVRTFVVVER
jgi:hypothetical protein